MTNVAATPEVFENLEFPKIRGIFTLGLKHRTLSIPSGTRKIMAKQESRNVGIYFRDERDHGLSVAYVSLEDYQRLRLEMPKYTM